MSAMAAGPNQDKIVSVLHAQLKRVHGRLARTEALLCDEREARRDAERQLRARDDGEKAAVAAPTRKLVEEAVAKAARCAAERDRAISDAAEGRQALAENGLLKRGMSNLSTSFEQQEERLKMEIDEMAHELRRARAYARRCREVLLQTRAMADALGAPEDFLGEDEDASDDCESPPGHPADDTTVFLDADGDAPADATAVFLEANADDGRVELFDFDGGDELDPSGPAG
jgi:hypothetical protein